MGALSKNTPAAVARREVEERTGMCANMAQFGFRPTKYTLNGEVTRFTSLPKGTPSVTPHWLVLRTTRKEWRVVYVSGLMVRGRGGISFPAQTKLGDGIRFPGPCAAAVWLEVEKSNGNGT